MQLQYIEPCTILLCSTQQSKQATVSSKQSSHNPPANILRKTMCTLNKDDAVCRRSFYLYPSSYVLAYVYAIFIRLLGAKQKPLIYAQLIRLYHSYSHFLNETLLVLALSAATN